MSLLAFVGLIAIDKYRALHYLMGIGTMTNVACWLSSEVSPGLVHLGLPVLVWLLFNVVWFVVCKMTAIVYMAAFQIGLFWYNSCTFHMSQQYRTNAVCSLLKEVGKCSLYNSFALHVVWLTTVKVVNTMITTQTTFSPPPWAFDIACVCCSLNVYCALNSLLFMADSNWLLLWRTFHISYEYALSLLFWNSPTENILHLEKWRVGLRWSWSLSVEVYAKCWSLRYGACKNLW
jgi:TRAP-type C4-dicarboxylate transport system permease large subunit